MVAEDHNYIERVSSNKTEALFLGLTLLFFILSAWRIQIAGLTILSVIFLILFSLFLFYSLNYRVLVIQITMEAIVLKFGIFTWKVPMVNIDGCTLDTVSLWRIGGAGIHFSFFQGRYRAMFNFLEYPRVLLSFKKKKGPVRDFAFTTKNPEKILDFIQAASTTINSRKSPNDS